MSMAFELAGKSRAVRPSMNVTPLVDVVLVLLIIFMVITPLLARQFSLRVPPKEEENIPPPPSDGPPPVVLTVGRDGRISLNQETISPADLSEKLSRVLAARTDRVVFFDAHDDAPYGVAINALDLARSGGAATIAVLPDPIGMK